MNRELFVLVAVGLWASFCFTAGCRGSASTDPRAVARAADTMPPFAVAAKSHTGSLSVHSFAREGVDDNPAPSPDGSWLVFASTRNSEEPQLYRQPSAGSVVTQLTSGPAGHVHPAVSPDAREIAYAGDDSGQLDVWIMPAAGGSRENLTSTRDLEEAHPTWHPSGRALAFQARRLRDEDGQWWVCAKSRGASGLSWVTPGENPHWSPKGDRIVFQRAKARGRREYSVWTVEVAVDANDLVSGGAQSQIVADPTWSAVEPAFSPDGERIAFVALPVPRTEKAAAADAEGTGKRTDRAAGGDIWCVRLGGTDLVRLTATPASDRDPAWAGVPGKPGTNGRVFFASQREDERNIWSLVPALATPGPAVAPTEEARDY